MYQIGSQVIDLYLHACQLFTLEINNVNLIFAVIDFVVGAIDILKQKIEMVASYTWIIFPPKASMTWTINSESRFDLTSISREVYSSNLQKDLPNISPPVPNSKCLFLFFLVRLWCDRYTRYDLSNLRSLFIDFGILQGHEIWNASRELDVTQNHSNSTSRMELRCETSRHRVS